MNAPSFKGRYLFVAGLHRTGTSLVAKLLAEHPEVAAIEKSPAPENEGCYLQGAIPHTAMHGIPGRYATDPAEHLVEGCVYDALAVQHRMDSDWARWFAPGEVWRVEKSPVNLTRMRLYQQLFPMAQFVIVLRHPAVMAAALAKWTDIPASELIDYALDAYEIMERDTSRLHCALTVRYEDLVNAPRRSTAQTFAFMDLPPVESATEIRDGNIEYAALQAMTKEQRSRAQRWGYGQEAGIAPYSAIMRHPLRAIRDACEITD